MSYKQSENKITKELSSSSSFKNQFHILTITLLSLLLPLSFLLLARLSSAYYLLTFTSFTLPSSSFFFSLLLNINPALVHTLVAIISLATLMNTLTGKLILLNQQKDPGFRPNKLYRAWIFLCTFQVCVGLGIEGSISAGVEGTSLGNGRRLLNKFIFLLGLHETMLRWSRIVVKPVVDDTVYGAVMEERWAEKVAMAVSCGGLWWLRLRDEIESLVILAEVKKEMGMNLGFADFVGWWLYYLTVAIGMAKMVKSLMWIGMVVVTCRTRRDEMKNNINVGPCENDDKV